MPFARARRRAFRKRRLQHATPSCAEVLFVHAVRRTERRFKKGSPPGRLRRDFAEGIANADLLYELVYYQFIDI